VSNGVYEMKKVHKHYYRFAVKVNMISQMLSRYYLNSHLVMTAHMPSIITNILVLQNVTQ